MSVELTSPSISRVLLLGGALIALLLGSGFATGQEVMQYFVAYGYFGVLSIALMFLMFLYVSISFVRAGHQQAFKEPSQIFAYYGGRWLGGFFDYFSVAMLYMSFWVMVAGAGATAQQQFGIPVWLGGLGMGVVTLLTLLTGFKRAAEILGTLGPVLCLLVILIALAGLFSAWEQMEYFEARIEEFVSREVVLKAGTTWYTACASYVGFCMMWMAVFLANLGKSAVSRREASLGVIVGVSAFSLAALLLTLSYAANVQQLAGEDIPTLVLIEQLAPALTPLFSVVLMLAIYTTAVPLLWTPVKRFAVDEKSARHRVLLVLGAASGTFIGLMVPFAQLINVVYVLSGYVGFFLLFLMLAKDCSVWLQGRRRPLVARPLR